jgi:hypothetical protein
VFDRGEKEYNEYFETMPWLSIGFGDKKREQGLSSHFDVSGIPCLVLLDAKDLSVINASAVGKVRGDVEGKNFPWYPEVVKEIDQEPEGIDEGLSLILLQEDSAIDQAVKDSNKSLYTEVAKKYKGVELNGNSIMFFSASTEGRLASRVRQACSVKEEDKFKAVKESINN